MSRTMVDTPVQEELPAQEMSHQMSLELHVASISYLHSTAFLRELNSCASDFLSFLSKIATSISSAATDLALGILQRRTESISRVSFMDWDDLVPNMPSEHTAPMDQAFSFMNLKLDIVLGSPIVVLPRTDRSHQVLVAHLGSITIKNETLNGLWNDRTDRVHISIENINLHSLDLSKQVACYYERDSPIDDPLELLSLAKGLKAAELYSCQTQTASPIMHKTEASICLERKSTRKSNPDSQSATIAYSARGQLITPLHLSLQRNQYGQILDTIQHINASTDDNAAQSSPIPSSPPSALPVKTEEAYSLNGSFNISKIVFELCPEGGQLSSLNNPKPHRRAQVQLLLEDLNLRYEQSSDQESMTEITLGSVQAEDLSLPQESPHRILATSIGTVKEQPLSGKAGRTSLLSISCPQLHKPSLDTWGTSLGAKSCSLPLDLNSPPVTTSAGKVAPSTPPPSEYGQDSAACSSSNDLTLHEGDNLIHFQLHQSKKRSNENDDGSFVCNRRILVDFNTLDIIFSLQSWVIILDFFGIGSPRESTRNDLPSASSSPKTADNNADTNFQVSGDQEMVIQVKSLSVVLNHSRYEVARASVIHFYSRLGWTEKSFTVDGTLRKFLLSDLTPAGHLYQDRFTLRPGHDDMLTFEYFQHLGGPQIQESQPFDASLKLQMASVVYIHTQRFYAELTAFFQQFLQHQHVMSRIRVASMGASVSETASRGMRLKLDVEAGSPLLLLPVGASSSRLLIMNLGSMKISNRFCSAGESGTISSQTLRSALSAHVIESRRKRRHRSSSRSSRRSRRQSSQRGSRTDSLSGLVSDDDSPAPTRCLLDVWKISLTSMNLKMGDRLSVFTEKLGPEDMAVGGFVLRYHDLNLLRQTCELQLQVERNLDKALNHQVPDLSLRGSLSSVHVDLHSDQYSMLRGVLAHNLGENLDDLAPYHATVSTHEYHDPHLESVLSGIARTCLYMNIDLKDVILDLRQDNGGTLGRISLVRSALTYESFSDGSRDIDLVSQDILLHDLRFDHLPMNKRPNVYSQIVRPLGRERDAGQLQAEVHFRLTPETHRTTVLVNNMRLLGIFDWWLELFDFITLPAEDPPSPFNEPFSNLSDDDLQAEQGGPSPQSRGAVAAKSDEPLYPSAGILSRRAPMTESPGPVFELKLNVTDCDLIIIADPSASDSTAVILRSTTVLAYRPDLADRPFSCNLNNAEVFSCKLGHEEDSALSIIDPVTINVEIAGRSVPGMPSQGLSDLIADPQDDYNRLGAYERTAEIQLQQLSLRFSYQDWQVFDQIFRSFPRQAHQAWSRRGQNAQDKDDENEITMPANADQAIQILLALGFKIEDCRQAWCLCQGQVDEAALWLTKNCRIEATPDREVSLTKRYFFEGSKISFTNFEVKVSGINLCLIDDRREADIPLIDISLHRLHLHHDFEKLGEARGQLSASYYNPNLSTWEPWMEPCQCHLGWKADSEMQARWEITAETEETINVNLTSSLLELYQKLIKTDDLETCADEAWNSMDSQVMARGSTRRRQPFIPFAIENLTGTQ